MKEIKELKRNELLKLKVDIESRIQEIDTLKEQIKVSQGKNCLSDLVKDEKIFCINFKGSIIYNMDYVKINFNRTNIEENKEWIHVHASHETKSLGCSISIHEDLMSNHCFLYEFASSMYFFTMKPETWKEDLLKELDRGLKNKEDAFNKEVIGFKHNIMNILNNNDVDNFLSIQ